MSLASLLLHKIPLSVTLFLLHILLLIIIIIIIIKLSIKIIRMIKIMIIITQPVQQPKRKRLLLERQSTENAKQQQSLVVMI